MALEFYSLCDQVSASRFESCQKVQSDSLESHQGQCFCWHFAKV